MKKFITIIIHDKPDAFTVTAIKKHKAAMSPSIEILSKENREEIDLYKKPMDILLEWIRGQVEKFPQFEE